MVYPGAFGEFAFGEDSGGVSAPGVYVLYAGTGTFALTGVPATIVTTGVTGAYYLDAGTGVYHLTGVPADLHASHSVLIAGTGAYVLTGVPAAVVVPFPMSLTTGFTVSAQAFGSWREVISTYFNVNSSTARRYIAGGVIQDTVVLHQALAELGRYHVTHADTAWISALAHSILPAHLTETITMSATVRAIEAILVAERFAIRDVYAVMAKYHLSIHETARILSNVFRHVGGDIHDTVTVGGSGVYNFYTYADVVDSIVLAELFGQRLIISVTSKDEITLTASDLVQMIFSSHVTDQIDIDIAYVAPSGNYTTWAINTRTNAVSEYRHYTFNSFAKMGNRYIAAASDGIYELLGADDDGAPIPSTFGPGFFQPGGGHYAALKAAYIGMAVKTGSPGVFLKLITGDNSEYLYSVNPMDRMTARVEFGKGLRSRYYSFELSTAGVDYDFDTIDFIPLVSKRRFS